MQAVVEAAAIHQTAGELVNDDDLALFDDVVDVTVHNAAGFDGAVNVVAQGHIVGVGQVLHMEEGFGLLHAGFGQSSGLALFVLLRLIGEHSNLFGLAILDGLGSDRRALHIGSANLHAVFRADCDYLVKGDLGVRFDVELLDENSIARFHLVLLAAGFDDCVHNLPSFITVSLFAGGKIRFRAQFPANCASPEHAA